MKDVIKEQELQRAAVWHTLSMIVLLVLVSAAIGGIFYFCLGGV